MNDEIKRRWRLRCDREEKILGQMREAGIDEHIELEVGGPEVRISGFFDAERLEKMASILRANPWTAEMANMEGEDDDEDEY